MNPVDALAAVVGVFVLGLPISRRADVDARRRSLPRGPDRAWRSSRPAASEWRSSSGSCRRGPWTIRCSRSGRVPPLSITRNGLRARREERGLGRADLAAAGATRQTIDAIEREQYDPLELAFEPAAYFGRRTEGLVAPRAAV